MPLLKRIEKRLSKKEKEDELGITDLKRKMKEMKEAEGEGDDAGSESDSDSDSDDSDDSDGSSDDDGGVSLSDEEDSSSDEDEDAEQEDNDLEGDSNAQTDVEQEEEPLPLESVLENPIYSLKEGEETEDDAPPAEEGSGEEEAAIPSGPMGCMLCPNRVLKHEQMVEVHLNSKSHKRAAARFAKKIADPTFDRSQVIDPRDISKQIEQELRTGRSLAEPSTQRSAKTATSKTQSQIKPSSSGTGETSQQTPKDGELKPKRQRAWKEAKKEAKRRRTEAKETGQLPRKEAARQVGSKKDSSREQAPSKKAEKSPAMKGGAQKVSRSKDGKKSKAPMS